MIVDPSIEEYLDSLLQDQDSVLQNMERLAKEEEFPHVGPHVGKFLFLLTRMSRARSVFEMGSGFGYSAVWFARALPPDGVVHLTDPSRKRLDQAGDFLEKAGLKERARFHQGDALEIIDRMDGPFDIVFNDVDKEAYPATIDKAARVLRPGGLFVTDNALWYGKVTREPSPDQTTAGVVEFNKRLVADHRFDTVFLPLRDGIALSLRC
jgi:caffeoyl-CoA O-methyltransferase